jgi:hypothetical protein
MEDGSCYLVSRVFDSSSLDEDEDDNEEDCVWRVFTPAPSPLPLPVFAGEPDPPRDALHPGST